MLFAISILNTLLKLTATKVLIPLLAKHCSKSRTNAEVDVFLLVGTFAVESMQTLLFIVTSFTIAHQEAAPHLGGTDRHGFAITERAKVSASRLPLLYISCESATHNLTRFPSPNILFRWKDTL